MRLTAARVVLFTFVAALVVFCGVQDRVTAAGARRYVSLRTTPGAPAVRIDEVMAPAVRASVLQGLAWSGGVAAAGLGAALIVARRSRRG